MEEEPGRLVESDGSGSRIQKLVAPPAKLRLDSGFML